MTRARSFGWTCWLAVALLLGGTAGMPVRADLVGLYRFEDASNPGKDSSPAGNNLTAFGGWSIDPNGRYGQGLGFNGLDAVLGIDDGTGNPDDDALPAGFPLNHNSYTLAAWVNTTVLVNEGFRSQLGIIGWGAYGAGSRCLALRLKNDGNPAGTGVRHYWWGNDLDVNDINLSDGTYHHIAAAFDSDSNVRQIYIDGQLANVDAPAKRHGRTGDFRIGRTVNPEFFQGTLDDVAVFNQWLNQDQIQKIMTGDFSAFGVPP
jgi:Concanavalin A-like lectin/glucanases superfamily